MSYSYQKEIELLEKWERQALKNGDKNFTYDGLLCRGRATQDVSGNWTYQRDGNESEIWRQGNSLLFLTKDLNGDKGDDIRTWTCRENKVKEVRLSGNGTKRTFFSNMAKWSYGFNALLSGQDPLTFSDVSDDMAIDAFDRLPIARINCIKEAGGSSCHDKIFRDYFKKDGYLALLKEEILLFCDAKIIYCGGSIIFDVIKELFPNIKISTVIPADECRIFNMHINSNKILVINGWHPAYPGRSSNTISQEDAYNRIMSQIKAVLRRQE